MAIVDHLEKLRHFLGVARAGSIRGYAVGHNLSQPSISKAVRILEADLEATLFVRNKEGVVLTPAGQEVVELAEDILGKAKSVEESIRLHGSVKLEGRFILGTYQSIAVYFLPKLLLHLNHVQKNLRLDCVTAPSAALVKSLQTGAVDFTISIDPPQQRGIFRQDLFEDTYSLYCHAQSEHKPKSVRIFTLPSAKDGKGKTVSSFIEQAGLEGQMVESGDFEAAKAMVENNVGWAILPENVAGPLLVDGRIKKAPGTPRLQGFGNHSVVFSCLAHRSSDQRIKWIAEQIRLMLHQGN